MDRRKFIKRCVMGGCSAALGAHAVHDFFVEDNAGGGLGVGFRNDAPAELWKWSREAAWYESRGEMVRCVLCPHECILGENDRGFCRVRVVKNGKLHTLVYGNPCTIHIDPMEKKPLYHFLPGSAILSLATAGCNLRCPNCQNWEISQAKPETTQNMDVPPAALVDATARRNVGSIAYTYSEPIIYYEYVRDSSALAKERGIRNVLVTAGFISEKPLRELCRVVDAATLDLKGFNDRLYIKLTGSKLAPVLRCLEVMREEGMWIEVSRLVVPTHSDDIEDIRRMCKWIVQALGPGTPLHFLRFHPAHKLQNLPPTPTDILERARDVALEAGLHFVYVGNVPGHPTQNTVCPGCKETAIERDGFFIKKFLLDKGRCACGEKIPGVWA